MHSVPKRHTLMDSVPACQKGPAGSERSNKELLSASLLLMTPMVFSLGTLGSLKPLLIGSSYKLVRFMSVSRIRCLCSCA